MPTGTSALSKKIQLQDRLVAINGVEVRVAAAVLYLSTALSHAGQMMF